MLGLTLPTAAANRDGSLARLVGLLSNLNGQEDWFDGAVGLEGEVVRRRPLSGGGAVGLRLGGIVLASTEGDDAEAWARGGIWGRRTAGPVELRGDLSGQYLITVEDVDTGGRSTFYLTLVGDLVGVGGGPGLFVRLPLDDDASDPMDVAVGLRMRFW